MEKVMRFLETISMEEEKEKFVAGREGYGGDFRPQAIAHEIEEKEEVLDFANYCDLEQFSRWIEDKESFSEYVSQYMQ